MNQTQWDSAARGKKLTDGESQISLIRQICDTARHVGERVDPVHRLQGRRETDSGLVLGQRFASNTADSIRLHLVPVG